MAETIDPERLLRGLAAAIGAADLSRSRLVSTRETYEELRDRTNDPLAGRLSRWVLALLYRRANHAADAAIVTARATPYLRIESERREVSCDEVVASLLRGHFLAQERFFALVANATPISDVVRVAWARRGQMRHVLGGPRDPWAVVADGPLLARRVLDATDEIARSLAPSDLPRAIALGAGHGVDVSWPRQLSEQALLEPFRGEAGWLDVPSLPLGPLPEVLAPASFVRAIAKLGERWGDATVARDRPLALAVVPSRLDQLTMSALFASLLMDRPFVARLGMSDRERARAERQVAIIALTHVRRLALSVTMQPGALDDAPRAIREAFEQHAPRALSFDRVPTSLALVLPQIDALDESRLAGCLRAATLSRRLREAHDEDWYRNRRAVIDLRHTIGTDPPDALSDDERDAGLAALVDRLSKALS